MRSLPLPPLARRLNLLPGAWVGAGLLGASFGLIGAAYYALVIEGARAYSPVLLALWAVTFWAGVKVTNATDGARSAS